jgi:glycosyltransferase involved in cell wall biosynthesis
MTVYNDLRFLDVAVDSILRQEFRDLELVIVDDGTGEDALFKALERRDPRIRIVVNPTNLGTAAAANRGIDTARADIILRLDADDIAEPTRVGRLVAALADDPQLGLIGSWCTLIDEAGQPHRVERMRETDLEIRWTILFHNPFYQSTAAFRRSCFEAAGRYKIEKLISEDHYLWFHMLPLCRARNIAEPLVRYRLNPRGRAISFALRSSSALRAFSTWAKTSIPRWRSFRMRSNAGNVPRRDSSMAANAF